MDPRRTARAVFAAYEEHDVLTYASALAFKLTFALIPMALAALGLLGMFNLDETWRSDIAPQAKANLSAPAFALIDDTVRRVLSQRQLFWATVGLALAIWEVSGATRGVMGVLDRVYRVRRKRSFTERVAVSLLLAVAATVLGVGAVAVVELGPQFLGPFGLIIRLLVALALLAVLLAILVRYAPAEQQSWHLVTRGGALTLTGWATMSVLFAVYLRDIADYGSIFGNLTTVIVVFEYVYLSMIALLTGLVVDRLANGSGESRAQPARRHAGRTRAPAP